jgi:Holliday junction resolvase RusA-like endonuclease
MGAMTEVAAPALVVAIPGKPRTQGSMTLWTDKVTGRERAKYAPEVVAHRNLAVGLFRDAWAGAWPLPGPVAVRILATFARPLSHYGTGRNAGVLKDWAPVYYTSAPDGDKIARLVLDALTIAGVYKDDGQVAVHRVEKVYGERPSTLVEVWGL